MVCLPWWMILTAVPVVLFFAVVGLWLIVGLINGGGVWK